MLPALLIRFSLGAQTFQPDKWAFAQELRQGATIGQNQRLGGYFSQWIEYERPCLHMVVRHLEAGFVYQSIPEQQNIEIQCARSPALMSFAALTQLDGLQGIQQLQGRQCRIKRCYGVGIAGLARE